MQLTNHIAKLLRDAFFGGNWTGSNLREQVADVGWQQATARVEAFHSIAALVYHVDYYVAATLQVMQDGPLDSKDELSFDHPAIESDEDWQRLLDKTWSDAENLAVAIEQMPESRLWETFVDEPWGNYYRCLHGPIEHCYYHVGQIAMLKRLLAGDDGIA